MNTNIIKNDTVQCANFNLKKAGRVVSKMYAKHLAPIGLKGTQFSLLMALYLNKGQTISQLAEGLVMDRTSLTRALKPLERDGLVVIIPGEKDRRVRNVAITEKGKELSEKAIPLWEQAHAEFLHRFGDEKWKIMRGLLQEVIQFKA